MPLNNRTGNFGCASLNLPVGLGANLTLTSPWTVEQHLLTAACLFLTDIRHRKALWGSSIFGSLRRSANTLRSHKPRSYDFHFYIQQNNPVMNPEFFHVSKLSDICLKIVVDILLRRNVPGSWVKRRRCVYRPLVEAFVTFTSTADLPDKKRPV